MLKFHNSYEILKTTKDTPEFQLNLIDELLDLDKKLENLRITCSHSYNGPIKMTVYEACLLKEQYDCMRNYYYKLISRCEYYNLINHISPLMESCCKDSND